MSSTDGARGLFTASVDGAVLVGVLLVYVIFLAATAFVAAIKDKTMKDAGVKLGQGREPADQEIE